MVGVKEAVALGGAGRVGIWDGGGASTVAVAGWVGETVAICFRTTGGVDDAGIVFSGTTDRDWEQAARNIRSKKNGTMRARWIMFLPVWDCN